MTETLISLVSYKQHGSNMNSRFCKLNSAQPLTPGICLFRLSAPWKRLRICFWQVWIIVTKEVKFCNTEKSPKQLLRVLILTALVPFATAAVCQKSKGGANSDLAHVVLSFYEIFCRQFFLMSSSNLVLSVVQKLRSPYFTTAMQKRNARKILKVRSPHSSTIFASMMRSLPPHRGVVLL